MRTSQKILSVFIILLSQFFLFNVRFVYMRNEAIAGYNGEKEREGTRENKRERDKTKERVRA